MDVGEDVEEIFICSSPSLHIGPAVRIDDSVADGRQKTSDTLNTD